jgi:hypothetical protein
VHPLSSRPTPQQPPLPPQLPLAVPILLFSTLNKLGERPLRVRWTSLRLSPNTFSTVRSFTSALSLLPRTDEVPLVGFAHSPQVTHPILGGFPLSTTLSALNWEVASLPLESQALAFAAFAIGALLSASPLIVGEEEPLPAAATEVLALGPDLRVYGRRRRAVCGALKDEAFRFAKEANVMLYPTTTNAGIAMLLNSLADTGAFISFPNLH